MVQVRMKAETDVLSLGEIAAVVVSSSLDAIVFALVAPTGVSLIRRTHEPRVEQL